MSLYHSRMREKLVIDAVEKVPANKHTYTTHVHVKNIYNIYINRLCILQRSAMISE